LQGLLEAIPLTALGCKVVLLDAAEAMEVARRSRIAFSFVQLKLKVIITHFWLLLPSLESSVLQVASSFLGSKGLKRRFIHSANPPFSLDG
jgi:hypothetical protein